MSKPVVLVVEGAPLVRRMLRAALQQAGCEVAEAMDGRTAMQALQSLRPRLVFMDQRLPDTTGPTLALRMREDPHGAELPIIAVSGVTNTLSDQQLDRSLFAEFLLKPVSPNRLQAIARSYLPSNGKTTPRKGPSRRILVVDDDELHRQLLVAQLERAGFEVRSAPNGRAALAQAKLWKPHAVVADLFMAEMDGVHLLQAVRDDAGFSSTPVVLVGGQSEAGLDEESLRQLGASAVLKRSPDTNRLVKSLDRALNQGPPTRPTVVDDAEVRGRIIRRLEHQAGIAQELRRVSSLQAAQLSVLAGVSEALTRSDDLRAVLGEALARCLDVRTFSVGAAWLRSPEGRLELTVQQGIPGSFAEHVDDLFGNRWLLERTLASDEVLIVPSRAAPRETVAGLLKGLAAGSALLVPLARGLDRLGVVLLASLDGDLRGRGYAFARTIQGQLSQAVLLARSVGELRSSERRFRGVAEAIVEALIISEPDGSLGYANPSATALFGYDQGAVRSLALEDLLLDGTPREGRWRAQGVARDGQRFPVEVSTSGFGAGAGRMAHVVRDITHEMKREQNLVRLAHEDELTGLLNRRGFFDQAARVLLEARQSGRHASLLYLDLDRFKTVNDTLGHEVGDALLAQMGRTLRSRLRAEDAVGRLGGDEFAVIVTEPDAGSTRRLAAALLVLLRNVAQDPRWASARVTPSMGVASFPDDGEDARSLLRAADLAMYRAQRSGGGRVGWVVRG